MLSGMSGITNFASEPMRPKKRAQPRKRKKAKPNLAKLLPELIEVVARMEKRVSKIEKVQQEKRRPIGFYTDCVASQEIPEPFDDENEV